MSLFFIATYNIVFAGCVLNNAIQNVLVEQGLIGQHNAVIAYAQAALQDFAFNFDARRVPSEIFQNTELDETSSSLLERQYRLVPVVIETAVTAREVEPATLTLEQRRNAVQAQRSFFGFMWMQF